MRGLKETDILLVEDNPHDAELALHALGTCDLRGHVRHVKDGAEALAFLFGASRGVAVADPRPRVILLDIKLPRVGGLEVLERIKSDEHTRTIPVVMLTSSAEEKDIMRSYALGANSYVVKPVEFEMFVAVVAEVGRYWVRLNHAFGPDD